MALVRSFDVNYSTQTRSVQLHNDGVIHAEVDYIIVSTSPGDYAPTKGTAMGDLYALNVNMESLSRLPAADFRPQFPVWIAGPIKNQSFKYVVVFEPANVTQQSTLDLMTFAFSAIRAHAGTASVTCATELIGVREGALERLVYDELFYAACHWASMKDPFTRVQIHNTDTSEYPSSRWNWFEYQYTDLRSVNIPGYTAFYNQCKAYIDKVAVPSYLTRRQALGICIYTSDFYSVINSALRSGDHDSNNYRELLSVFEAADTGLRNIADFTKACYRGDSLNADRIKENEPGNDVTNVAYTSTSYVNTGWYSLAGFRFTFNSKYGAVIENYSVYKEEKEVLFGRFMNYHVNTLNIDKDNIYFYGCDENAQALRR